MKQRIYKKWIVLLPVLILSIIFGFTGYMLYINADDDPKSESLGPIELNQIDYDSMLLTLNTHGNTIVYYSTNKKKWYEIDETLGSTMTYDISWISTGSTKLYFRGNNDHTTLSVVIPAYNKKFKVKFDKVNGNFNFNNTDGGKIIRWRKTTDYKWKYIWVPSENINTEDKNAFTEKYGNIQELTEFEQNEIPELRVKGTKLIFQIVPINGTKDNEGVRASKEAAVKIPVKKAAPNMKVNIKKLTINTTAKQQWVTTTGSIAAVPEAEWKNCTKAMALNDIDTSKEIMEGKSEKVFYFRTSATTKNCESKVSAITIPAREAEPTSPASIQQVPPASSKGKAKAKVAFTNVPSTYYEYVIIKNGTALDETRAAWKTIKTAKTLKFTEKSLPAGSVIYVRVKGTNPNVKKGIDLKLPSKCTSIPVPVYPKASK